MYCFHVRVGVAAGYTDKVPLRGGVPKILLASSSVIPQMSPSFICTIGGGHHPICILGSRKQQRGKTGCFLFKFNLIFVLKNIYLFGCTRTLIVALGIFSCGIRDLRFPRGSVVKNLPANAGDSGSIPGSGRSPGEGNGHPVWYSCLGNPVDRRAWQAIL